MLLGGRGIIKKKNERPAPPRSGPVREAPRRAKAEGSAAHVEGSWLVHDRPRPLPLPADQGVHESPSEPRSTRRFGELLQACLRGWIRGQDVRLRPRRIGGEGATIPLRLPDTPVLLRASAAPCVDGGSTSVTEGPPGTGDARVPVLRVARLRPRVRHQRRLRLLHSNLPRPSNLRRGGPGSRARWRGNPGPERFRKVGEGRLDRRYGRGARPAVYGRGTEVRRGR